MLVRMMLVAGGLILLATTAWAQEPSRLGFKEIWVGMSKGAFRPIWQEGCRERAMEWPIDFEKNEILAECLKGPIVVLPSRYRRIGTISLYDALVDVRDDKVGSIILAFWQRDYEALRAAFVERYGPPTQRKIRTWKNKLGTSFNGESLSWERREGRIILDEFSGTIGKGSAQIASRDYLDGLAEEQRSRTKKDAGGL